VYVSANVAAKAIGFARTLVFVHLLAGAPAEYNVWAIGSLMISLAGTALCLGANQALTRYVSVYQSRGELAGFVRRVAGPLLAAPVVLAVPALLAAGWIASWVAPAGQTVTAADVQVARAAVLNGAVLAVYIQMVGLLQGLRTYRLASAVELFFTVLFTVVAVAWVATTRRGVDLLWGHLASLAVATAVGLWLTARAISNDDAAWRDAGVSPAMDAPLAGTPENVKPTSNNLANGTHNAGETPASRQAARPVSPLRELLKFGLPALAGQLAWLAAPYAGYFVVHRRIGDEQAGVFASWMLLAQVVYFVANAAWQVVYSHAARQREDDADGAFSRLVTSYKALGLLWLALAGLMYATGPLWMLVLPEKYRLGQELLGGLLLLYAAMTQTAILTMTARLLERPAVIAWSALAGGAAGALLAWWWTPAHGVGTEAAWAGGLGMLTGGAAVTVAWVTTRNAHVGARTYVVLFSPALLLTGMVSPTLAAACTLALLVAAFVTPILFSRQEKQTILHRFRRA